MLLLHSRLDATIYVIPLPYNALKNVWAPGAMSMPNSVLEQQVGVT